MTSTPLPSFTRTTPGMPTHFSAAGGQPVVAPRSVSRPPPGANVAQQETQTQPYQPQPPQAKARSNLFSLSSAGNNGAGTATPSSSPPGGTSSSSSSGARYSQGGHFNGAGNQTSPPRGSTGGSNGTRSSPPQVSTPVIRRLPQSQQQQQEGPISPAQQQAQYSQAQPQHQPTLSGQAVSYGGSSMIDMQAQSNEEAVAQAIQQMKEEERRRKEERKRKREEEETWARSVRNKLDAEASKIQKYEQSAHDANRELYALFNDLQCISHE